MVVQLAFPDTTALISRRPVAGSPDDPVVHQPVVRDDDKADCKDKGDLSDDCGLRDEKSGHPHEQELQQDCAERCQVEFDQIAKGLTPTAGTIIPERPDVIPDVVIQY